MNTQIQKIRVFGALVNSNESYVDYNVVGVNKSGGVHLENVNDATDTTIWTTEKIQSAFDNRLAFDGNNIPIPSDGSWDALDKLTYLRQYDNGEYYNNFSHGKIEEAQKSLFLAIAEEGLDK